MLNPNIEIGQKLTNAEVAAIFDCSLVGTMRKSKEGDTLVLISDFTKKSRHDAWINHVLHYTGAGKTGDQDIHKGQNATLCDSRRYKIDIQLFELMNPGEYTYCGQAQLDSNPYAAMQPGEDGRDRMVWIFPMRPVHDEYFGKPEQFVFADMDEYKANIDKAEEEYEKVLGKMNFSRSRASAATGSSASRAGSKISEKPAYVYQAPVKEVIEIPTDIVGKRIKHKRFGEGTVVSLSGQSIEVEFDKNGNKKLGYEVSVRNKLIEVIE